jgi:hypothetical protein
MTTLTIEEQSALERLLRIAASDSGQSGRVAAFLLAWHNARDNGGWDPVDLWDLDRAIVDDILITLALIARSRFYLGDPGPGSQYRPQIEAIIKQWHRPRRHPARRSGHYAAERKR